MKIELGQKCNSTCGAPVGANDSGDSKAKMIYPSLYFTHDKPVDLPDEGTAVIKFRKIESSENTRDPDSPKYRCEIEVHSIEPKGGSEPLKVSLGEKIKDAMAKKKGSKEEY